MNTDAVTATGHTVKPEHIANFTGNFDTREGWKAAYQAREREAHDLSEHIIALGQQITQLRTSHAELVKALEDAIFEYDLNTCKHESTHRGGAIWTICDDCGANWADDRGGFQPYQDPARIVNARTALAAAKGLE